MDEGLLSRMASTLQHRGPDDHGQYVHGAVGLAHRRLSIIDLSSAGRQPMSTPDGRFVLVFNGEIYNYRELRDRYLRTTALRSTSDTEVLLHLLERRGVDVLSELRGMFALALWDNQRQELLLARDPFGKKPLYYADLSGVFLFASEVKALLEHPAVSRDIDHVALVKYFLYESVPAPLTGFRDIRQVPMGHYVRVVRNGFELKRWWWPRYVPKYHLSEREALNLLDAKLATAVRRRMVSDVPVGVFLSGGVDSTTIAWYMRRATEAPLHTFSISFSERSFNESHYAQQASQALGTLHHEMGFALADFHRTLARVLPLMDIPFADASLLPTYAVSELARSVITVALDGDGGDELLAGYGTFFAAELSERLPRLSPRLPWQ